MIRFLDPWMLLFAAAAAAAPLVAWLGRREGVPREWAAMEILARAVDRTTFRRRCVDWLVVAMRSVMLLAVAFAAARPLLLPAAMSAGTAGDGAGDRERRAVVVGDATAVAVAIESAVPGLAPVRAVPESRLDQETFDDASLVVLADGVVPGSAATGRLRRFVEGGGGLVMLVGPRSVHERAAAVNRFAAGLAGVGIRGEIDRRTDAAAGDPPAGETVLLSATPDGDAAMELVGPTVGRRAALVAGVDVPGVAASPRGPPVVLARAAPSGDPLAVRIGVGRGGFGLVAVPLTIEGWVLGGWAAKMRDTDMRPAPMSQPTPNSESAWSDLPAWPEFLPFVERTILPLMAAHGSGDTAASPVAGWLAGRNLSGLSLVAALTLLLLEPLVSRWVGPWSRTR